MTTATLESTTTKPTSSKSLHFGLWVAQVLLAAAFAMAGSFKVSAPIDELARQMAWVGAVPPALVRFIGTSELLGALGLILPSITRVRPALSALAALGLVTIMALAIPFHLTRGEPIVANIVLGTIAAFVAWGRFRKAPIAPRD